jgi:hypothetical protein
MSKVRLAIYIVFFITPYTAAQDYIPMNFDNGRWFVEVFEYGGYFERIQLYCDGDTVINDQMYSRLFQNKFILIPPGEFFTDTIVREYIGAIRNADNRLVIFRSAFSDTAAIIYDFNLSIGDTIYGEVDNFIINGIDSVEYCGIYHKRYIQQLNGGSYDETLIEGIGFSNGILGYFYPFDNGGENTRVLECYMEKDNQECPACENLLNVTPRSLCTEVYPIPTNNNIIIKSVKQIIQIRLLNIFGSQVFNREYNNQLIIEESIAALSPGIYIIELFFSDSSRTAVHIIRN